jgi:hypothetical protein
MAMDIAVQWHWKQALLLIYHIANIVHWCAEQELLVTS